MSVKIRLNNKRFLGEGLLIGSRLNEEGEAAQQSAQQPTQPAQQQQEQTTQSATNASTAQTGQQQQGQQIDQQVNKIIYDGFSNMVKQVETQLKQIQLPAGVQVQWVQTTQPKDQTLQSVWASVQQFLTGNIKAVSTALQQAQQQNQQQAQQPVNNANAQQPQNSSTAAQAQ